MLRHRQLWLTLGIGAIGYGGLFCVYTYLASTLLAVTHVSPATVPVALAVFGTGQTLGNLIAPRFADRALMPTAGVILAWSALALALAVYPFAIGRLWTILPVVLALGIGGALGTVLQTRLMDIAQEGQGLAAALNHSAFNIANAIGPWAGGLALAAGYGWASIGWVGAALAGGPRPLARVHTVRGPPAPVHRPAKPDLTRRNFCTLAWIGRPWPDAGLHSGRSS